MPPDPCRFTAHGGPDERIIDADATPGLSGHLFITRGSLLHLACDAVLVPSGTRLDRRGYVTEAWRSVVPHKKGFVSPCPEGKQRVVKVRSGDAQTPAVWLGHTGERGDEGPRWYAQALTAFIAAAGADVLNPDRARPLGDERPVLGVPLVGVGQGGMRHRKGEVVVAIVGAILTQLATTDVDVVLVVRGAQDYAAAQQARSHLLGEDWNEVEPAHQKDISRLAAEARHGRLVLFMGAGTGIGAGLPTWGELLQQLGDEAGLTDPQQQAELRSLDPRDAGATIERRLGRRLPERIVALVDRPRSSLVHQLLASLPVSEAITTNYDTLFEQAWTDAGRAPFGVLPHKPDRSATPWLLKLHGSIDDLQNVVLSRGDYLRFEGRGAALAGIVQAMLLTRHMLFVGYSLSDDNFHRIAHQVRGALDAAIERPSGEFGTALTPSPEGLGSELWDGDVRFVSTASGKSVSHPARRLAILLDRLGYESSAHTAHLLEPSYRAVFSKRELALRALLDKARRAAVDEGVRPALGRAVLDALATMDGDGAGIPRH